MTVICGTGHRQNQNGVPRLLTKDQDIVTTIGAAVKFAVGSVAAGLSAEQRN